MSVMAGGAGVPRRLLATPAAFRRAHAFGVSVSRRPVSVTLVTANIVRKSHISLRGAAERIGAAAYINTSSRNANVRVCRSRGRVNATRIAGNDVTLRASSPRILSAAQATRWLSPLVTAPGTAPGRASDKFPPTENVSHSRKAAPVEPPSQSPVDRRVWRIAASSLLMGVAIGVVLPLMPVFIQNLGFTPTEFGLVVGVLGLTRLACNIPAAWAGDRFGRRPLLYGGPFFTAWGMGAMATATALNELVFYRFLTGVGGAAQMTGASLYLSDISNPQNRARTMAPMAAAFSAGAVIGPAIGGYMADATSLSFPFYFTGLVTAIAGINNFMLPETLPKEIAAENRAHSKTLRQEFVSTLRQWQPLLRDKDMRSILLTHFSYWVTAAGCIFTLLPLVATNDFGLSASSLGSFFGMMAVVNVLGSQPAASLSDRLGRKSALVPGLLLASAAVTLMPFSNSVYMLAGCALLWGVGSTTLGSTPTAFVADRTNHSNRSQALALLRSAGDLGLMLGPMCAGLLVDSFGTVPAYLTFSGLLLAALANFYRNVRNEIPSQTLLVQDAKDIPEPVTEQNQSPIVAAEVAKHQHDERACEEKDALDVMGTFTYEHVVVEDATTFDEVICNYRGHNGPVFVWVAPSAEADTGESWCPDADKAASPLRRMLSRVGGVLIDIPVCGTVYNAEHPLRAHPTLRLRAIPSLMLWDTREGQNKPLATLIEAQCFESAALHTLETRARADAPQ